MTEKKVSHLGKNLTKKNHGYDSHDFIISIKKLKTESDLDLVLTP